MTAEQDSNLDINQGPQEYVAPTTLGQAAEAVADGNATILAGGTDLMLQTAVGHINYRTRLVNIRRVAELRGVSKQDDEIRIGAATTITDIRNDELLSRMAPVLVEAANHFAGSQIRNAATIGGNICNASPAGDTLPALLILDAEVELTCSSAGTLAQRRMPLTGFFTGPGQTAMLANELLSAIVFRIPEHRAEATFIKSGPRPALEISIVSAAISAIRDTNALFHVRLAFGAVAPVPLRATATEAFIEGKTLDDDLIEQAVDILMSEINPIDDVRATAWYRRHLAAVYLRRLLVDEY
ncbi:MAG: xanthine dehydrogenase family protein subunit M [Arenicellales bacterium]|nr:xanthine dehydrogenase family protein subunit M [Arenicellales bacterium]